MIEFEDTRESWDEQSLMPPSSLLLMSISRDDDGEGDEGEKVHLPPPSRPHQRESSFSQRPRQNLNLPATGSKKTPLVEHNNRKRRVPPGLAKSSVLFGPDNLDWNHRGTPKGINASPKGLADYFFGFMMEDSSDDPVHSPKESEPQVSPWNRLNISLFLGYFLTSSAAAVPVTLIPSLVHAMSLEPFFPSRVTGWAVFGTAMGKFINGPLGDLVGARRVSLTNAILLATSLVCLAISWNETSVLWACFWIEFCQSVQWPCVIVILAQHYGGKDKQFEGGIYVTSLAPMMGRLLSIPLVSMLLRTMSWRIVVIHGSLVALTGASVIYYHSRDAPTQWHVAQNPISTWNYEQLEQQLQPTFPLWKNIVGIVTFGVRVARTNVLPVLQTLLTQAAFWIVALAHSGDVMVQSSQRVLGSYFQDTSFGTLPEDRAGGLSVVLSLGIIAGLVVAGGIFTRSGPTKRKRLILKLYMLTILSCYLLGLLAIPRFRVLVGAPSFILSMQVIVTFFMGLGIAVQTYIPGLVGATYGKSKGLFCSYTDGVAFLVSSCVWKVVSNAVHSGNPEGGGWAYGWAAVALLEILCAIVMVEFMQHHFVRQAATNADQKGNDGGYETILFV
jgi:MFS family permease